MCHFLLFSPFGPSFPFILAFWAFILSFWPFGASFPFILAFWAFISLDFGFLGVHFLSFWPFGLSFPFILAFWAFISFHFLLAGAAMLGPRHKLAKTVRFLITFKQILSAARPAAFCNFWPLGLHFLSFWPFGLSCPFILAFWAFISFHFNLLGLHFLSFWPFGPSFPFILAFWGFILFILAFWDIFSHFGRLNFVKKPSGQDLAYIPKILQFCLFLNLPFEISFFGPLGLHVLSFWPFGP